MQWRYEALSALAGGLGVDLRTASLFVFCNRRPTRLRAELAAQDMSLLAPHRTGRTRPSYNDERTASTLRQALQDRKTVCLAAQLPSLGRLFLGVKIFAAIGKV